MTAFPCEYSDHSNTPVLVCIRSVVLAKKRDLRKIQLLDDSGVCESRFGGAEAARHGAARPRRRPSRTSGQGGPYAAHRARLRPPGGAQAALASVAPGVTRVTHRRDTCGRRVSTVLGVYQVECKVYTSYLIFSMSLNTSTRSELKREKRRTQYTDSTRAVRKPNGPTAQA